MTYSNGDGFRGVFTDNKKNGKGTYYNKAKDETLKGTWKMDVKDG